MKVKRYASLFLALISLVLVLGCAIQPSTITKTVYSEDQIAVQNDQDNFIDKCYVPHTYTDTIGVRIVDSLMKQYPEYLNYDKNVVKKGWEYTDGVLLAGIERLSKVTRDSKYLEYVKPYVDKFVFEDPATAPNVIHYWMGDLTAIRDKRIQDVLQPSNLIFDLLKKYPENAVYKTALDQTRAIFPNPPNVPNQYTSLAVIQTNSSGGFFHKPTYQFQLWLDGLYMSEPFITKFGRFYAPREDKKACFDTAVYQLTLIADKTYDPSKNLFRHGWLDWKGLNAYNLANPTAMITPPLWADPTTGNSPEIWSRASGWYAMALVDVLDNLPRHYKGYRDLLEILNNFAKGLTKYQADDGLWYQVIDKGDQPGNFKETSGSAMFVYALEKAVRHGYISHRYRHVAEKGWEGIKTKVAFTPDATYGETFNVADTVGGMSILKDYATYVSVPRVNNSAQGIAAVLLASTEMEFNHRQFNHW